MALSLLSGGRTNSLWEPCWSDNVWEPFNLVDFAPAPSLAHDAGALAGTKVDWLETNDAHVSKADLPGLKKEGIKVELEEDRVLQIIGERSQEQEKKGGRWHTVERSHGRFVRRFRLPINAQVDTVSAQVENGVLTVTVPKIRTKKNRNVQVF